MALRRQATRPAPSGAVRFDERLSVPWSWWLAAFVPVGLLEITVRLGHPEVPAWLPVLLLVPVVVVALARLGRHRVTVTDDGTLRVGSAHLPARYIAAAEVVPAKDKQEALGPNLDPLAYVFHRPWIGPLVRVTLNDPEDPTPYWLFSTRRSEALVACLECLRTDR